MKPAFSVVVTAYNYRHFVTQAIDGALQQSHPALEVIVVDDGSTDGTTELLRERYGGHDRVQILAQVNGGQLAAFASGIRACQGSHIALLDADDWWDEDYLAALARAYTQHPDVDLINANMQKEGRRSGPYHPSRIDRRAGMAVLRVHARHSVLGSPTSAISLQRDLAQRVVSIPADYHPDFVIEADAYLLLAAGLLGANFYTLGSNSSVHYRLHDANGFAGHRHSAVELLRRSLRLARAAAWWSAELGLAPALYRQACTEFATIEKPSFREFALYLWLQLAATEPLAQRLLKCFRMARHYRAG